jgi:hypothetical protein
MHKITLEFKAFLVWFLCTLLGKTWRLRFSGHNELNPLLSPVQGGVIYCFWHCQILQFAFCYRRRDITTLVSSSKDGDLAVAIARRWGHATIRGSSTRRGFSALRETVRALEDDRRLAIIPDGPRGPACKAKPGVAEIGLLSGMPIIPLSAFPSKAWRINSWDRFVFPKPFATIEIKFHEPVYPQKNTDKEAEMRRIISHIDATLGTP